MKHLFLLLFLVPCLSWGQDSTNVAPDYLQKSVWRIEFFGPGVINESRIGRQTTVVSHLRTVGSFVYRYNTSDGYAAYTINPQLSVAVRQFYNFARRIEQGKSIRYNSGNYVTAKLAYVLPPIIEHNTDRAYVRNIEGVTAQVMWGFQRTYRKNFYLNMEAGLGFGSYYSNPITVATNFTLGYTFPYQ